MNELIEEMSDEVSNTKQKDKESDKGSKACIDSKKKKVTTLATKCLLMLKELKINLHEMKDNLADESQWHAALEQMSMVQLQINRQRPIGRRRGVKRWHVPVVQLMCELLVGLHHVGRLQCKT